MIPTLWHLAALAAVIVPALGAPARAEEPEPDRIRGVISEVGNPSIVVKTRDGKDVRIELPDNLSIFALSKGRFTDVWLHKGFELRIIDDELRGIALGHKKWDLTPNSIISHGWVDDIEVRVLSIKWGPTDYDETDVEVPRNAPVHRMSLGNKSLIKPGAHVLAGANKAADGRYVGVFLIIGKDGVVPAL